MEPNKTIIIDDKKIRELSEAIREIIEWITDKCPQISPEEIADKVLEELGPILGKETATAVKKAIDQDERN